MRLAAVQIKSSDNSKCLDAMVLASMLLYEAVDMPSAAKMVDEDDEGDDDDDDDETPLSNKRAILELLAVAAETVVFALALATAAAAAAAARSNRLLCLELLEVPARSGLTAAPKRHARCSAVAWLLSTAISKEKQR
jgi:hypothetical protein